MSQSLSSDYIISNRARDVEGDPYLNEDFLRGVVHVSDNVSTGELFLRFNTERNMLEFKKGDGYYGLNASRIKGFTIYGNPDNLVFRNGFRYEDEDITPATLLRVVYDGDTKLVAHHTTSLKEGIASYGSATQKDEYVDDVDFYIVKPSGELAETKLKKKDILRDLDENLRDQVERYADEQDLDFGEESDVKKILNYYDGLQSGSGTGS